MGPEDHIQVDLADLDQTQAAIAEIKQRLDSGELNALVNNAAISPKAESGKRLSSIDTTIEVWDHIFRVNLRPLCWRAGCSKSLRRPKVRLST
jgi:NAD(P)-dependent dehydrogenase (short-subunit alcohol dehydrogenase family)